LERCYEAFEQASSHPNAATTGSRAFRFASRISTPNNPNPQKAKALLRMLIDELRVNGRTEIVPTYRHVTPEVCPMSEEWAGQGSNLRPWD
jgi:hypothetical protein